MVNVSQLVIIIKKFIDRNDRVYNIYQMNTLEFRSYSNNAANSLFEITIALCLTSLIITYLINDTHNNSVNAKQNYIQWREEKKLEIKNVGLLHLVY